MFDIQIIDVVTYIIMHSIQKSFLDPSKTGNDRRYL